MLFHALHLGRQAGLSDGLFALLLTAGCSWVGLSSVWVSLSCAPRASRVPRILPWSILGSCPLHLHSTLLSLGEIGQPKTAFPRLSWGANCGCEVGAIHSVHSYGFQKSEWGRSILPALLTVPSGQQAGISHTRPPCIPAPCLFSNSGVQSLLQQQPQWQSGLLSAGPMCSRGLYSHTKLVKTLVS